MSLCRFTLALAGTLALATFASASAQQAQAPRVASSEPGSAQPQTAQAAQPSPRSSLPPMAPTTAKAGTLTNVVPPLPAPLPPAVMNTVPAGARLVSPLSPASKAGPESPIRAAANTPAGTVSNLPPGPLSSSPIGITTAPNEIRISGLGTSSTPWSIIVLLTGLSLLPSLLICLTPFARLLVVFHFLRQALGLQTTPSNQTLIGLTMILTFFIMQPVGKQIYKQSFVPLQNGEITAFQAIARAEDPMRNFMVHFVREKDAALFLEIAKEPRPHDIHDLSMRVLLPAYIVSELKAGFQIGAVLFLPFLVVDMVVASITTSVGMMQLPPVVISTPLKLLLFLMVDGWHLLIGALMRSFY